jgi:hypothetical protein
MAHLLFTAVAAALLAAPAPKDEPIGDVKGAEPKLAVARVDDAGVILMRSTVIVYVPVQKEVAVNVNGQIQKRVVTETVMQTRTEERKYDPKDTPVYDVKGEKVDAKTLADRLKNGAVVVVSTDGQKPDPAFLKALKEDTLVLVPPVGPTGPAPPPPPPPEKK